jgi:hypothetical protein
MAHLLSPSVGPPQGHRCHFLELPAEVRNVIYKRIFFVYGDEKQLVEIEAESGELLCNNQGYGPSQIRRVCKQLYAETSDLFFQACGLNIYFNEIGELQRFLHGLGKDNRRLLRHLKLSYCTLDEDGEREDIDPEIWGAVAGVLKRYFDGGGTLLEKLELESCDDRNGRVRFGASPLPYSRAVAIESTVEVMKLVQLFPFLTFLCLEEIHLLNTGDEDGEYPLDGLPIINFLRKF